MNDYDNYCGSTSMVLKLYADVECNIISFVSLRVCIFNFSIMKINRFELPTNLNNQLDRADKTGINQKLVPVNLFLHSIQQV
jgi:hypothetical protein